MALDTTTYDRYMDLIADSSPGRLYDESHLIIERFRNSQSIISNILPTTFLIDYTTKKYIHIDGACTDLMGRPARHYLEVGLDELLNQTCESDREVVYKKVFPVNFQFLKNLPVEKYTDIIFSHNFRIHKPDGTIGIVFQRYSYIPGPAMGKPVGVIGIAVNITHFKTDLSIVHTIEESIRQDNEMTLKLLYKETYPVYDIISPGIISGRELEVLKHLSKGLTSKQIAAELKISINTVNNHRKNMLRKTSCKSAAELLSHAARHGLL